jgi:hypothetical protein
MSFTISVGSEYSTKTDLSASESEVRKLLMACSKISQESTYLQLGGVHQPARSIMGLTHCGGVEVAILPGEYGHCCCVVGFQGYLI